MWQTCKNYGAAIESAEAAYCSRCGHEIAQTTHLGTKANAPYSARDWLGIIIWIMIVFGGGIAMAIFLSDGDKPQPPRDPPSRVQPTAM